jgi:hypothetical protein
MIGSILRVTLLGVGTYVYGRSTVVELKKPSGDRNNLQLVVSGAIAGLCACAIAEIVTSK